MLLLHIIIAITTVGFSGFTLIKPTSKKLKSSYLLTASTFATGTYLVIMSPAHLVSACFSGITFLAVVGSILYFANSKLSKAEFSDK